MTPPKITTLPPDPRLSPDYEWPMSDRPHTMALAEHRAPTNYMTIGVRRMIPTQDHKKKNTP